MNEEIKLIAEEETEELIQYILDNLPNEEEAIQDLERKYKESDGFAGEPLTISVIIGASTAVAIAIVRLAERWMESERQIKQMKIIADVKSEEARKELTDLAKDNNKISISYGLTKRDDTEKVTNIC